MSDTILTRFLAMCDYYKIKTSNLKGAANLILIDISNQYGSATLIYDNLKITAHEIRVRSVDQQHYYKWINSEHTTSVDVKFFAQADESASACSPTECLEDILAKVKGILCNTKYDTRVVIKLEIEDGIAYKLMQQAHQQDITLNEYFNRILMDAVDAVMRQQTEFIT